MGRNAPPAPARSCVRVARLSGQSSCPRGVNLFGMWRVQRLDQIKAFKPANLFDFKSLALKIRKKQIGRFKTVIRPKQSLTLPATGLGGKSAPLLLIGRTSGVD